MDGRTRDDRREHHHRNQRPTSDQHSKQSNDRADYLLMQRSSIYPHQEQHDHPQEEHRTFTLLNMPQEEILKEIKDKGLLKEPAPLKTDPKLRNRKKFCYFHRDHGHTTANCFKLRKQIESLFKDGLLQEYLYQPPETSTKKDKGKEPLEEVATIFGGIAAGPSAQARKRLARQARCIFSHHEVNLITPVNVEDHDVISFSSRDAHGIHHPHCDALVLTVIVANKKVEKSTGG